MFVAKLSNFIALMDHVCMALLIGSPVGLLVLLSIPYNKIGVLISK